MKRYLLPLLPFLLSLACTEQNEKRATASPSVSTAQIIPTQLLERKFTYLEREIDYILQIWPGEYDNVEQLDFDKMANQSRGEQVKHERLHTFIERIDLPAFGEHCIYLESYRKDDPGNIHMQRIYQLIPDEKREGIRLKVFDFEKPKPLLSVQKDLSSLKDLMPDIGNLKEACDLILRREGMDFRGEVAAKECLPNVANESFVYDPYIRISEDEFSFGKRKYDLTTKTFLAEMETPYILEKARCFACMIDFPREKNGRPVETRFYIQIHDQGGKFEFDYTDGRHMVLGMRNTWSYGMQRETFVIFIQEGSQEGPTLIYSWGEPGADRIGFNPGWIRVQCDLDTERNRELQHYLRPDS